MIQLNTELKQDENGYWIASIPGTQLSGVGDNEIEALIDLFKLLSDSGYDPTMDFIHCLLKEIPAIKRK
jgi:hypothetical protein